MLHYTSVVTHVHRSLKALPYPPSFIMHKSFSIEVVS